MIRRFSAACAALLLVVAGCSEIRETPLAPETQPRASTLLEVEPDVTQLLQFLGTPDLSGQRSASKRISAATGGFVEINGFRVDIPAGALPADTTVTITLPGDALAAERVVAEFEPHGIRFNAPVTLSFPLTGVILTGDPIEVARWENGGWTSLGGSMSADGSVLSGTTPHFSTYGGKIVMAGG